MPLRKLESMTSQPLACGCTVGLRVEAGAGVYGPVLCDLHQRSLGDTAALSGGLVDVIEQLELMPHSSQKVAAIEIARKALRRAGIVSNGSAKGESR